jgi:pSer/pThr/pTyr-binding forkhead associated (FHA) protein
VTGLDAERTEIGIVCGQCDQWNPIGIPHCASCAHDLSLLPRRSLAPKAEDASSRAPTNTQNPARRPSALAMMAMRGSQPPRAGGNTPPPGATAALAAPRAASFADTGSVPQASAPPPQRAAPANNTIKATEAVGLPRPAVPARVDFSKLSQEELMEQARNYVCRSCSSGVPTGHKFCGRCGEAVPPEIVQAQTLFFGDMQNPAKAKLILIRGEGMDGLSFHLKAEQHVVGRDGQLPFPDDPFVSRRHANFFYRNAKLVVRDEGSLNGVYLRVRGTVDLTPGDTFLAGEQLFRLEMNPRASDGQDTDGTYFYSSPKHPSAFRLVQILQGGAVGMTVCARGNSLQVGREGGDLNFPGDLYMSGSHCRIEEAEGRFTLTDLNSRNGTYLRLKTERELGHGDYLFIGRKLLRVELNTN